MSLKIKKDRSNIDIDIVNVNDFIGNWNVQADEELTKLMAQQIQDSINIEIMKTEIMKTLIDSAGYIDSHPKNIVFGSFEHPMYRPELTVKLNKSEQIVF